MEQKDLVHCVTGRILHDSVSGLGKRREYKGGLSARFGDDNEFWTCCTKNV